jgi:tripartite-type tricarboxylate transporter receptor subunit TctC
MLRTQGTIDRRSIGILFAAGLAVACGGAAKAQSFPTRPVTLIVPFTAGGVTDVILRALAASTEKHLGAPIVVENRAGAAGTLGPIQMAATVSADGYTISQLGIGLLRAPLMRKMTFDPATDLTYIIGVTGYTYGIAVRTEAPWKTLQDLLDDARARPNEISFGTVSNATPFITMQQIAKSRGIQWVPIPFKGDAEIVNALLGGHIDVMAGGTTWGPFVNAGTFRLLVTWGATRTKNWPNVPTLKEAGIDMVVNSPFGLGGPKGINPTTIRILHDAFKKGMDEPSFRAVLDKFDQEAWYLGSDDYRAYALREIAEQKRIVEEFGLKPD